MFLVSSRLASAGRGLQNARTRSVAFSPDEPPARTSPAAPESLSRIARRPLDAGNWRRDHRRSGQQSCPLARFSPAILLPTGRTHSADTHWRATAKPLLLEAYLPWSPTIHRFPIHRPSTISGSAGAFGYRQLDV